MDLYLVYSYTRDLYNEVHCTYLIARHFLPSTLEQKQLNLFIAH